MLKRSKKKIIFCFANFLTKVGLHFILKCLLYQIGCDKTEDGLLTDKEKYCASSGNVYKMKEMYKSMNRQNLD